MRFNTLCQQMIDAWISCDPADGPEKIYGELQSRLGIRMRLSMLEIDGPDPRDWYLRRIRSSRISARLLNLEALFKDGRLRDFDDQAYLEDAVYPIYRTVAERRQPHIDLVETKLVGMRVVYDRILLPHKSASCSWMLSCTNGRFMARLPDTNIVLDPTDEAILENLLNGCSAKEIAAELNLSPRTIEHRLEKLKVKFGAKSLPHLAAMFVASGFTKSIEFTPEPS